MGATRTERDSMGEMQVPAEALWGASTQRAVLNFPISGYRFGRRFIRALGLIKYAAAVANRELGLLDAGLAELIQAAALEVVEGRLDGHFVLDIFQTGSGTSTNMNANEVIANRAMQIAHGLQAEASRVEASEGPPGFSGTSPGAEAWRAAGRIHPNDHVNLGQSSNDVIPSAIHLAAVEALGQELLPAAHVLHGALRDKADEFDDVVKVGRTHLMDATPIRLGQEFSGYAAQISHSCRRIEAAIEGLRELPIGGTAVGTGINAHPRFAGLVCRILSRQTGEAFREAANHFQAQASMDAIVALSGALRTLAISLAKIANDIRWLGSGPRCGLGELRLPAVQPGSSIMPGKVNPVICESVLQVCAQVVGNDSAVTYAAGLLGNLDLHVGMPVMAYNLLESIRLLANVCPVLVERCIRGLEADRLRCAELIERSLAMCTALVPLIGYDAAAAIAQEAAATGKTVRQVALERKVLSEAQLQAALDPWAMTGPGRAANE